jgi:branched-chain amino acid transport system permease protein
MEVLRFLDGPLNLIFVTTQGLPGLRMVVFSLLLMVVVIYRQQGLMGKREFSWDFFLFSLKGIKGKRREQRSKKE